MNSKAQTVGVGLVPQDLRTYSTNDVTLADQNDVGYDVRRQVKIGYRTTANWVQLYLSHNVKNAPWKLQKAKLAYLPLSKR